MPSREKVIGLAIGLVVLAATLGLLSAGTWLAREWAPSIGRIASLAVNTCLALLPASVVLLDRRRRHPGLLVVAIAFLLLVGMATFNLHAATWVGLTNRGSAARLVVVLTGLLWPCLAAGALVIAVAKDRRQSRAAIPMLAVPVVIWVINLVAAIGLFQLLSAMDVFWRLLIVFGSSVLLQQLLQTEFELWRLRRLRVPTPEFVASLAGEVAAETGASIEGLLCVDAGAALVAQVGGRLFGTPLLALSTAMIDRLDAAELRAVISHELAHVVLNHLKRRLWWSLALAEMLALGLLAVSRIATLPRPSAPIAASVLVLVGVLAQRFVANAVFRVHEREADDFAAGLAGREPMIAALRKTHLHHALPFDASMWTTHDSLETRERRLRSVS